MKTFATEGSARLVKIMGSSSAQARLVKIMGSSSAQARLELGSALGQAGFIPIKILSYAALLLPLVVTRQECIEFASLITHVTGHTQPFMPGEAAAPAASAGKSKNLQKMSKALKVATLGASCTLQLHLGSTNQHLTLVSVLAKY